MKREEAVRIIKECKEKGFKHTFYTLNEYHTALDIAIKALEQEPKTGHWIKIKPYPLQMHDYECSECLHETDDPTENYCSECGAKMIEPQESEDKE